MKKGMGVFLLILSLFTQLTVKAEGAPTPEEVAFHQRENEALTAYYSSAKTLKDFKKLSGQNQQQVLIDFLSDPSPGDDDGTYSYFQNNTSPAFKREIYSQIFLNTIALEDNHGYAKYFDLATEGDAEAQNHLLCELQQASHFLDPNFDGEEHPLLYQDASPVFAARLQDLIRSNPQLAKMQCMSPEDTVVKMSDFLAQVKLYAQSHDQADSSDGVENAGPDSVPRETSILPVLLARCGPAEVQQILNQSISSMKDQMAGAKAFVGSQACHFYGLLIKRNKNKKVYYDLYLNQWVETPTGAISFVSPNDLFEKK